MLPTCALKLNSLFFFCDYKEKSLRERIANFMHRNIYSWFVKPPYNCNNNNNGILMPFVFKYLLLIILLAVCAFLCYRREEYLLFKWSELKAWLTKSKYFSSAFIIHIIPNFSQTILSKPCS